MNLILGATGRVGGEVINKLTEYNLPATAVVRNETKANHLKKCGVAVKTADYFDGDALKSAFQSAETVFFLTPENPESSDFLKDTKLILKNYREAIEDSNIKRIICLSSFGADLSSGSGNLEASYMLEHAFEEVEVEKIFIRATYYYSNWIGYLGLAKENGVLPTFLPPEFELPMISPDDVGTFIAKIIAGKIKAEPLMEIVGPKIYSPNDIAKEFGKALGKKVTAVHIPRDSWETTLISAGFSLSGAKNLSLMTDAVIAGKTKAKGKLWTTEETFRDYLNKNLQN